MEKYLVSHVKNHHGGIEATIVAIKKEGRIYVGAAYRNKTEKSCNKKLAVEIALARANQQRNLLTPPNKIIHYQKNKEEVVLFQNLSDVMEAEFEKIQKRAERYFKE